MKRFALTLAAASLLLGSASAQDWSNFDAEVIVTRAQLTGITSNTLINRDWGLALDADGDVLYSLIGAAQSGNFEDYMLAIDLADNDALSWPSDPDSIDDLDTGAEPGDFRPQGNPGFGDGGVTIPTWNGNNAITEIGFIDGTTGALSVLAGPDSALAACWGAKYVGGDLWVAAIAGAFGGAGEIRLIDDGVIGSPIYDVADDIRVFDVFGDSVYFVDRDTNQLFRIDDLSTTPTAAVDITPASWDSSENIKNLIVVDEDTYIMNFDVGQVNAVRVWADDAFVTLPYDDISAAAGIATAGVLSPSFEGGMVGRATNDGGYELFLSNFSAINLSVRDEAIYRVTFEPAATSVGNWELY